MGVNKFLGLVLVLTATSAACTKTVNECNSDSDCKDIAYPFCDVNGDFGPSGGVKNVCTIIPPDCPINRCGCSPGATSCTGSTLTVCNSDGNGTTATTCALGCSGSMDRCLTFTPLNGLGPALLTAATKPAVTLPANATIDSGTGVVKDSGGGAFPFDSIVITQTGAPDIRAYVAQTIDMSGVVITGSKAVAFVATGEITLHGIVDASANGAVAGPGAMEMGSCVGAVATTGGGGGNGTDGGAGAASTNISGPIPGGAGGKAVMNYEPLFGGCRGGSPSATGGGGGGGLQIVSGTRIAFDASAIVDAGGGGAGQDSSGGGAGGTIILESPVVAINGAIFANGAAGGACGTTAADGMRSTAPAVGATCGTSSSTRAGSGGTRTSAATTGSTVSPTGNAGGGGAVGRLLVRTADGNYAAGGSSLVSALIVTQQLQTQ